jgi:glucosamine kinase
MGMSGESGIVIGIDGGGTNTRVMAVDFRGNVLAYVEAGGSSPKKDTNAKSNVQKAIMQAVAEAGRELKDVEYLVAGLAGLDSEDDKEWAEQLTEMPGLDCPRWHVNDAVVAHAGAFLNKPGIIVISGTGSIIFAINEEGRHIRNYDFYHYASSAARFLSYDAVFEMLAGNIGLSDQRLVRKVLDFWQVDSVSGLRDLGLNGFVRDRRERDRRFGEMSPFITEAAAEGSALARKVCDKAVEAIVVGVELLGSCFGSDEVSVGYIGSVVRSVYIKDRLTQALAARNGKQYRVKEPALSAVAGSVLIALERSGKRVDDSLAARLNEHSTKFGW